MSCLKRENDQYDDYMAVSEKLIEDIFNSFSYASVPLHAFVSFATYMSFAPSTSIPSMPFVPSASLVLCGLCMAFAPFLAFYYPRTPRSCSCAPPKFLGLRSQSTCSENISKVVLQSIEPDVHGLAPNLSPIAFGC